MRLPRFIERVLEPIALRALTANEELLSVLQGGAPAPSSGEKVTRTTALTSSAVSSALAVIAETVGSLRCVTYQRQADGSRERATSHPVYRLLHDEPNEDMPAQAFFESMANHLGLRGNGYAQVVFNGGLLPVSIWPIEPEQVRPVRKDRLSPLSYEVRPTTGGAQTLPSWQICHFRKMSWDGVNGYDPLTYFRESFGFSLAIAKTSGKFFANAMMQAGYFTSQKMGRRDMRRLERQLKQQYSGSSRAWSTPFIPGGVEYKSGLSITPENAQMLQSRHFSVLDVARLYRIPPHLLAEMEAATYSNIEQQSIEFVFYTMLPWLTRFEQEFNRKLFIRANDRERYFVEFLIDTLLRGDTESRFRAYQIARLNGAMTANDWAARENWKRIPTEQGGDAFILPLNVQPSAWVMGPKPAEDGGNPAPASGRSRLLSGTLGPDLRSSVSVILAPVASEAANRIARRQHERVSAAARKAKGNGGDESFLAWADRFFGMGGEFASYVEGQLATVSAAMARALSQVVPQEQADRCAAVFLDSAIETLRLDGWQTARRMRSRLESTPAGVHLANLSQTLARMVDEALYTVELEVMTDAKT